jgi:hypothetical protein
LKVTLAFLPNLWRIPQVCVSCGQQSPALQQIPIETIEYTDWSGKRWRNWKFNFPYCSNCSPLSKKGTSLFSALKGEHAPVEANFVQSKKYGKMFRKKEAKYLEFTFKNDRYGTLFKEANEDLLFDKYLAKLQESVK